MRRYIPVGVVLALVIMMVPSMAATFQMNATDFAAALMKNTIANLEIANKFLNILNSGSSQVTDLYQNLWGVVYGGLVAAAWNNQITATVLDEIKDDSTLTKEIATAISYLGSNASDVFGYMNGSRGIAFLLKAQTWIIDSTNETKWMYDSTRTYLDAYAEALTDIIYNGVDFMIRLCEKIPNAWNAA